MNNQSFPLCFGNFSATYKLINIPHSAYYQTIVSWKTEIQPSEWQLPEEWPPCSSPHQTPPVLTLSDRQPSIRLSSSHHPILLPPGPLYREPEARRPQARGRHARSLYFIQRVHHSHPRPQTGGGFHWRAFRQSCEVRSQSYIDVCQMQGLQERWICICWIRTVFFFHHTPTHPDVELRQ